MKYYSLPKNMVWKMLQGENKERGFSVGGAVLSLLFDRENGKEKSQREYGRIWGRTRGWVRNNWDDIDQKADLILAKSAEKHNNPTTTHEQPENTAIHAESGDSQPSNNPLTTHNYSITNNLNNNTYSKHLKTYNKISEHSASPKNPAKSFSQDSWQFRFSLAHFSALKRLNVAPFAALKNETKTLQSAADIFDKLSRLDKYSQDDIKLVMQWLLTEDNWWIRTGNYASATAQKLRRKDEDGRTFFERFLTEAKNTNGRASKQTYTKARPANDADEVARIYSIAIGSISEAGGNS